MLCGRWCGWWWPRHGVGDLFTRRGRSSVRLEASHGLGRIMFVHPAADE